MLFQGFPENSLLLWNQVKPNPLLRLMSFKTNIATAFNITIVIIINDTLSTIVMF